MYSGVFISANHSLKINFHPGIRLTSKKENMRVLVFRNFVGAFTGLHSQEADDVTHRLCCDTIHQASLNV